jgi:hypothetical protein
VPVVRLGTAAAKGRPHVVVTFVADNDMADSDMADSDMADNDMADNDMADNDMADNDMVGTAADQKPRSGRPLKRLRHVGDKPVVTMLAGHYSED